jgi:hypothetical protein
MNKTFAELTVAAAAKEKANTNRQSFAVGEKVVIYGLDFNGAEATVIGHCTSLIGLPLVRVQLTELGNKLVFYPSELRKAEVK